MPIQEQLQRLLISVLRLLFSLFNPVFLIIATIIVVVLVKKNKEYKTSAYYQITKLPYKTIKHDAGRYGEYLTYKFLKHFEADGAKFLFNVFIPKGGGETTEIDVLMICSKGVFVFESKNYSGWIFGSEGQKNWCQTLPIGRGQSHKEYFYNPIIQNRSHIKHLKAFLGEQVPMRSIIVFSNRCVLKSIQIKSSDISVINRRSVASVVSTICNQISTDLMNESDIVALYNKLYPYTQVDATVKAQHILNVRSTLNPQFDQRIAPPVCSAIEEVVIQTSITDQSQPEINVSTEIETVEIKSNIANATTPKSQPFDLSDKRPQGLRCPKCNGNLILRIATRGTRTGKQFYGCSNYPKCKYIKNIE